MRTAGQVQAIVWHLQQHYPDLCVGPSALLAAPASLDIISTSRAPCTLCKLIGHGFYCARERCLSAVMVPSPPTIFVGRRWVPSHSHPRVGMSAKRRQGQVFAPPLHASVEQLLHPREHHPPPQNPQYWMPTLVRTGPRRKMTMCWTTWPRSSGTRARASTVRPAVGRALAA